MTEPTRIESLERRLAQLERRLSRIEQAIPAPEPPVRPKTGVPAGEKPLQEWGEATVRNRLFWNRLLLRRMQAIRAFSVNP